MERHHESEIVPPREIRLSMRSEVSAISPFIDAFINRLKHSSCVCGDPNDIEVALREALANAVIHGNREDPAKQVHLSFRCDEAGDLFFVVRDEGQGFKLSEVPDPTAAENVDAEHGRGILMMRMYMDEVHFEHHGTEVHMHKKCSSLKVSK
jgi:serine/threonine-protein kinase RsbW